MPELPEVEILVRHLAPLLKKKKIHGVRVYREKVLGATPKRHLARTLIGAKFTGLSRRGKYLLFELRLPARRESIILIGHLGMTGRIYLMLKGETPPKHAAVVLDLGRWQMIYEDTRYFGRFTLDRKSLDKLGPEPMGKKFTNKYFASILKRSRQAIKVKLLDQTLVAGVGNIYASEALFRAGISPRLASNKLSASQIQKLRHTIREVLTKAIRHGSTLPLGFGGAQKKDGLFYYGNSGKASEFYGERLLVYDRRGQPCSRCKTPIKRLVQAARSTFYCPDCQQERTVKSVDA